MFTSVLKGVFGLVGVLWLAIVGGYLVYWYDHRAPNTPSYTLHIGPFSHTFGLPQSLSAQLTVLKTAEAAAAKRAVIVVAQQAQIGAQAGAAESAAQTIIRTRTITTTREIPTYVSPQTDARYPLSWGFVRVHDAAARGVDVSAVSIPAGAADDTASGVKPSDALAAITGNYGSCRADSEQLGALQGWLKAVQAAAH